VTHPVIRPAPPQQFGGAANTYTLAAGTVLSRVHEVAYPATSFKPIPADVVFGGGRFDSTQLDVYDYLYAGETDAGAVAEALLRDIDANDQGYRFLPKKFWTGRRLSRVRTTVDVQLVTLRTGVDLGAIGAGTWLVDCDVDEYPQSRAWGHWIRSISGSSAGFAWLSKREPGTTAYVLFEDRCPPGLLVHEPGPLAGGSSFDDADGGTWLRNHLAKYRVSIRRAQTDT